MLDGGHPTASAGESVSGYPSSALLSVARLDHREDACPDLRHSIVVVFVDGGGDQTGFAAFSPATQTLFMDTNLASRITVEPGKRNGKPCIRGLRITVSDVLEYLASGMTEAEILAD